MRNAYAKETVIPIERSRGEIEHILSRYGAEAFMYATTPQKAMIAFKVKGRHIRMVLPMPTEADKSIQRDGRGSIRSPGKRIEAMEKEARRRWRAMALVIKAKLEAVTSGIAVFDDEFLAYMVLPNDQTVGEWSRPQLAEIYDSGKMPKMLPPGMEQ